MTKKVFAASIALVAIVVLGLAGAVSAHDGGNPHTFSASVDPSTLPLGGTDTFTFTIDNTSGVGGEGIKSGKIVLPSGFTASKLSVSESGWAVGLNGSSIEASDSANPDPINPGESLEITADITHTGQTGGSTSWNVCVFKNNSFNPGEGAQFHPSSGPTSGCGTSVTITVDEPDPQTSDVTICKYDEVENPLSDWEVMLIADDESVLDGTTGENGCVMLEDVEFGDYTLEETLQGGWENISGKGDSVVVDETTETFNLINEQLPECSDGVDNGDTEDVLIDMNDPGCSSPEDDDETDPLPGTGTLIVRKVLINDNGGTAATSSFSFAVNGAATTTFEADGENELTLPLDGTYTVLEVVNPNYNTFYTASCNNKTLGAEPVICTITNNDVPPSMGTIIVNKVVTQGGSTSTVFSFNGSWADFSLLDGGSTTTVQAAGQYSVAEEAPGWETSVECVSSIQDTEAAASIELDAGETVTCTFTNTQLPQCSNGLDDDGDTFTDFAGQDPGCDSPSDDNETDRGQATLTVTTSGEGEGIVLGTGISCDSNSEENDCTETYAEGATTTITATPDEGSNFDGSWSGACTGTNPVCIITMNGNQSVNAHFALNSSNNGGGGSSGGGGGGSSSRRRSSDDDDDGEVAGASTDGEVLQAQVDVPLGAPATGMGGAAAASASALASLMLAAGLAGIALTLQPRRA